jgi:hypothetical protein
MRHRTTEAVFDYFNHLRAGRAAPMRTEIDPAALKTVLPDLFILERGRDGVVRFRLAGTRVCFILGQEVRNREFGEVWEPSARHKIKLAADTVLANQNALEIAVETTADDEDSLALEMLLLPLYSQKDQCDRIFGSLVAIEPGLTIEPYPRLLLPSDLAFVPVDASVNGKRPYLVDREPENVVASGFGGLVNRITHLRVFEGGKRN